MIIDTPELKHAEFLHLIRDVVLLDLETLRETTEDARKLAAIEQTQGYQEALRPILTGVG